MTLKCLGLVMVLARRKSKRETRIKPNLRGATAANNGVLRSVM